MPIGKKTKIGTTVLIALVVVTMFVIITQPREEVDPKTVLITGPEDVNTRFLTFVIRTFSAMNDNAEIERLTLMSFSGDKAGGTLTADYYAQSVYVILSVDGERSRMEYIDFGVPMLVSISGISWSILIE